MMEQTKVNNVPNIRLFADRVLVKIITPAEVTTASGIFIPNTNNEEKTKQGTVLKISPKIIREMKDEDKLEEGDVLMFSAYAGSDIQYKGAEFKVLRITDIFGVLEPETNGE